MPNRKDGEIGNWKYDQCAKYREGKLSAEDESNPDIKNNEFVKALTLADFRRRSQGNKFFTAYGILLPKLTDDVEVKIRQNSLKENK